MGIAKKNGYSIVELLLVITILAVIAVSASHMLFTSLGGSSKASNLAVVKQNGDQSIQFIERQIRGAKSVACPNPYDQLSITDESGNVTVFRLVYDATNSVYRVTYGISDYITNSQINATNFICNIEVTSGYRQPDVVKVSFTLTIAPGGKPSETVSENFETKTSLRTY